MALRKLSLKFRKTHSTTLLFLLAICFMLSCDEEEPILFPYGVGASDYSVDLGNGYELHRSSADEITLDPIYASQDRVPAKVVSLAWNNSYILTVQHPRTLRTSPTSSYRDPNPDEEVMWIVETKRHKTYGPLTKEEYASKLQEIGINPDEFKWMTPDAVRVWSKANDATEHDQKEINSHIVWQQSEIGKRVTKAMQVQLTKRRKEWNPVSSYLGRSFWSVKPAASINVEAKHAAFDMIRIANSVVNKNAANRIVTCDTEVCNMDDVSILDHKLVIDNVEVVLLTVVYIARQDGNLDDIYVNWKNVEVNVNGVSTNNGQDNKDSNEPERNEE